MSFVPDWGWLWCHWDTEAIVNTRCSLVSPIIPITSYHVWSRVDTSSPISDQCSHSLLISSIPECAQHIKKEESPHGNISFPHYIIAMIFPWWHHELTGAVTIGDAANAIHYPVVLHWVASDSWCDTSWPLIEDIHQESNDPCGSNYHHFSSAIATFHGA